MWIWLWIEYLSNKSYLILIYIKLKPTLMIKSSIWHFLISIIFLFQVRRRPSQSTKTDTSAKCFCEVIPSFLFWETLWHRTNKPKHDFDPSVNHEWSARHGILYLLSWTFPTSYIFLAFFSTHLPHDWKILPSSCSVF